MDVKLYLNASYVVLILLMIVRSLSAERSGTDLKLLSRRRRYIAFPEGASFSCAGCMTVGVIGQPMSVPGTFTFGLNWGIAYELPNSTETALYYRGKHRKAFVQRRSRRELYEKLEVILDNMGYSGRQCILKTLCETTQRIVPHGENVVEEIFRIMFTFPMTRMLPSEPLVHSLYDSAHRLGALLESCDNFKCPLSLVDLIKGYYNAPPNLDIAENPWAILSSSFG